jgi:multidrug efflux pump subunit AcrA (membrane-fusion protein)
MKKKKWFFWTIVVLILGVAGFLGNNYLQGNSREQTQSSDLKSTIEVQWGSLKKTISASGYLQPVNFANLNLQNSGTEGGIVEKILVHNGESVEKEQELVHLKDKEERLNYLKAKNEYGLAKINGSASQVQEENKLAMEVAQEKLEAKTIRAPFSGKIVNIFVEEGDYVEATDDIIYLVDETAYEIEVSISEIDCLQVKVGQQAEVQFDALEDQTFLGRVTEVSDFAEDNSGVVTISVTIRMEEISKDFKPKFSALAEIIVDSADHTLLVPITSLLETPRGSTVLRVNGEKAESTLVQTGISDGFYTAITDGLKEGDRIVVNQYQEETTNNNKDMGGMMGGMMGGGGPPPDR